MAPTPTPQAVNCATFRPAPFDHGLSVPELYFYHAKNSPSHPVFTCFDEETGLSHSVTYQDADNGIRRAAGIVAEHFSRAKPRYASQSRDPNQPPVIGVCAISDHLSQIYLILAIMSLGLTAFPLSSRNSKAAMASLLKKTGALQVFVSEDAPMQTLARGAAEILAEEGIEAEILPMVNIECLSNGATSNEKILTPINDDTVTLILHSSGTTSFPKPIKVTKKGLSNWSNISCFGECDLAGKRVAAHTNPLFHALGIATIVWPIASGATFAIYKPQSPPVMPTPANFLASWVADKCNIVFCVPVFIEAWAQDPANLPKLQSLDCIVFSGASVSKSIGDELARAGVVMHPFWGSTEIGPASMFIPRDAPPPGDWDYFKLSTHAEYKMEPHPSLKNVFEPIMLVTETYFPNVLNTYVDGKPAFAIGDYLQRHPTDPERWKVYGRKDDQITLSTGENINPVPLEDIITQCKHIASAIMVGTYRLQPAVLVEPVKKYASSIDDPNCCEEFKELIWPAIETANAQAPEFAQIQKNMVILVSPLKPLEYTPKRTPRRPVCLKLYELEINNLYQKAQENVSFADRQFPDRR